MWVLDNEHYLGHVPEWDRGQQFGDGLFETLRVIEGQIENLSLHGKRFQKGLQTLGIYLTPPAEDFLQEKVHAILQESQQHTGIVKVLVTRGNSSRGYKVPDVIQPNVLVFLSALPTYPVENTTSGVRVMTCQTLAAIQPQLAGIKHLNRLENVLAAQELSAGDVVCHEGLLFNANHHLIEGTMSNVFLELNGKLLTPSLDQSGVAGTRRQQIIQYCAEKEIPLDVRPITEQELKQCDGLFLCNAVIGIWPVAVLDNQIKTIGPITQTLLSQINT